MKKRLLVLPALATAFAAVVLSGWGLPASAHAGLVGSNPADGQRVEALPGEVRLEFTEPISTPAYVVVTAADGTRVDQGGVRIDGSTVSVTLAGTGPDGGYEIAYRVVSEDGHAVAGKVGFAVGTDAPTSTGDAGSRQVALAVAAGLIVVIGALLLWTRRRAR